MIGRLNHVAIAVPDLDAAVALYRDTLGATVGAPQDEPDHGVTVVFIALPNTKIELLYPLGQDSPIPWQTGAVPAPEGFHRHADRTGAGLRCRSPRPLSSTV
jgi:methylmalonyl-CoA epimerase